MERRRPRICPLRWAAGKLICNEGGSAGSLGACSMLTIAHRGASALYPENTLCAFIAAAESLAPICVSSTCG